MSTSEMICYRFFIKVKDLTSNEEYFKVFDYKVIQKEGFSPKKIEDYVCEYIRKDMPSLQILDRSGFKIISSDEYGRTFTIPCNPNE